MQPAFSVFYPPQEANKQFVVIATAKDATKIEKFEHLQRLQRQLRETDTVAVSDGVSPLKPEAVLFLTKDTQPLVVAWWSSPVVLPQVSDDLQVESFAEAFVVLDHSQEMIQKVIQKVSVNDSLSSQRRLSVSWPNQAPHDFSDPLDGPLWFLQVWISPEAEVEERKRVEEGVAEIVKTRSELETSRSLLLSRQYLEASVEYERRHWWASEDEKERLIALVKGKRSESPQYVYHVPTIEATAQRLLDTFTSIDRLFYAIKANSHPSILQIFFHKGIGFECVSPGEIGLSLSFLFHLID